MANPSASRADTVTFSWNAASGATWYYLWVTDSSGAPKRQAWYTAERVGCASTPTCSATLSLDLLPGVGTWWVQTWNAAGFGGWTAAQTFTTSRHLFAVVASDGTLTRGTAVSASRSAAGAYSVVFGRNVSTCAAMATLTFPVSGPLSSSTGIIRASVESNHVTVRTSAVGGTDADRGFQVNVICR